MAKPAYKGILPITQANDSIKHIYLHGDEHYHYLTDTLGNRLEWHDGQLIKVEEPNSLRPLPLFNAKARSEITNNAYLPPRGIVLLVNFSDLRFQPQNNQSSFDSLLNISGYTYHGASGCVREYFEQQSVGAYSPQFDVYGPVTVNHTMSYYGANNDANAPELIRDACNAAKEKFQINFADYDSDNDSFVDFVLVFYAGYGEADGADENTIWQHMNNLYLSTSVRCIIDGKKIGYYVCTSELNYATNSMFSNPRDGISTCCHEFSHICGLPDLYDETNITLGEWDIMDNGTYNNYGLTPPNYSAYERFFCGWLTPTLVNTAADITLEPLNRNNQAVLLCESGKHNLSGTAPDPNIFYLLENRQQEGNDAYLPGHGLLITRIEYDAVRWYYNMVNSGRTRGVAIQPADGRLSAYGDAGDTYPGSKKIDSFNGLTAYPVSQITENNSNISLKILGGGTPIDLGTHTATDQSVMISANNQKISIKSTEKLGNIEVYDLSGRLITQQQTADNQTEIYIPFCGYYIVKVMNKTLLIKLQ